MMVAYVTGLICVRSPNLIRTVQSRAIVLRRLCIAGVAQCRVAAWSVVSAGTVTQSSSWVPVSFTADTGA